MQRIKKGDKVKIMAGALKGNLAEVERVNNNQVYLKGLKMVERHFKATSYNQGGKRTVQLPIDASNVALVTDDDKPTRIEFNLDKAGKVRLAKTNKKEIK